MTRSTATSAPDLARLLTPWALKDPRFREIHHRRNASRTWWVDAVEGRFVAKLAFDQPRYVEPGLRVAAAVANAGIASGPPVPTQAGDLCVEVDLSPTRAWTLALLTPVPGDPLSPLSEDAGRLAGDLLGRVHAYLTAVSRRDWVPAALLEWAAVHTHEMGNHRAAALLQAISYRSEELAFSVVYGDPSPEVIIGPGGSVGLIDWGTPSWGPQLHDVAAWLRWLGERPGSGSVREQEFLDGYRRHVELTRDDFFHLELFTAFVDALVAGSG